MLAAHTGALDRMGEQGLVARDLYAKTAAALRKAIANLPDRERALIQGHHYDGRPLKEVAAALGIPYATAKKALYSAIERLKKNLRTSGLIGARVG